MASNYQGIRFYNSLFITFASLFCFLYQTFTHKESFVLQYFESTEICFLQKRACFFPEDVVRYLSRYDIWTVSSAGRASA